MKLPQRVTIREVAPRDGFQSWPEFVPTAIKVQVIEAVRAAGVTEFETTAFVSPKAVPQMSDAEALMRSVPRQGLTHGALIPNLKGAQLAVAAGVDQLNLVISASEAHNMANFKRPIAESMAALEPIFQLATENNVKVIGAVAVAFGCPFSGEVPARDVLKLIDSYIGFGADIIALADTTGMASPLRIQRLVDLIRDRFPEKPVLLHLHNNRGSAMANLYAGLQSGVTIFDTALGGIGGCPNVPQASGNLATEDVVCMLDDMGVHTGVNLNRLLEAANFLEKSLGKTLPGQVLKSGPIMPAQNPTACCA